jgi:hypothetical protein
MRRLHQDTHSLTARTGMSLTEFAATADIDRTILYRIGGACPRVDRLAHRQGLRYLASFADNADAQTIRAELQAEIDRRQGDA